MLRNLLDTFTVEMAAEEINLPLEHLQDCNVYAIVIGEDDEGGMAIRVVAQQDACRPDFMIAVAARIILLAAEHTTLGLEKTEEMVMKTLVNMRRGEC
jgi:hypothetical protein